MADGKSKEEKRRIGRKDVGGFLSIVAVILIITVVGWGFFHYIVTNRIIETSIRSMEELSQHDEQAIYSSLRSKWNVLRAVSEHIRQQKSGTTEELLEKMSSSKQMVDAIHLTLVADNGTAVSSNMTVAKMPDLLAKCQQSGEHFIYRDSDLRSQTEGRGEVLVLGVEINPFTVEGNTYTYLIARMDIDTLRDELKVDCYEGRGYSAVIDFEGNYIVRNNRNYNVREAKNFYTELQGFELAGDVTPERIASDIAEEKSFYINYKEDEVSYVMAFVPMEETDWYFTLSVPRAVFEEQSMSLMRMFLVLMFAFFVAVIIIAVIILRRRSRIYAMEQKHQQEMADALALAEQANKAKTTFLNNMSHDIRTPMNAIIGFTALASTHIDNKEQVKDYLGKISQSSNHLLSLINDVLDMSRIESGKMVLEERPENLADILHSLRNIVQADIHAKQLELFIDTVDVIDEDIYCDKLRVNQILLNLLSNAIKFTGTGGTICVRIIQTAVSDSNYATYQFRVKDTGIGMSQEFAKMIFEPFTRERTSTVSGIQGTGLGMAITKNIVDMMNGKIEVCSEEEKGTEFIVTLSFRLQEGHKEIEVIKKLEGLRGLVVDDDINTCQSVSQMLRQVGMRAEWTRYGKEAVVRTEEALKIGDRYEVYIIDWLMPDMNGLETTRRIRKVVGDDAPIIILSAYDWADIEEEAREAGVTGFISKPLFTSDLHHVLAQVCHELPEEEEETINIEDFRGRRLLLAEDNELNREIAVELLQEAGFVIEAVENGKEAVNAVDNSEPGYFDAVLMDVQMPVMDGYGATREIRKLKNKELAAIPIIAMTANAFEEDKQNAKAAGMNAHIGKPIDIPVLFETLKNMLK